MQNEITAVSTRFRRFTPFFWKTMRENLEKRDTVIHNLRVSLHEAQTKADGAMLEAKIAGDALNDERQAHEDTASKLYAISEEADRLQKQNRCLKSNINALATGDYERVYENIRNDMDPEGWALYKAAKTHTGVDPIHAFPTEGNLGYFEALDGHGLIYWVELYAFGECEYRQLNGGYELSENRVIHEDTEEYRQYRRAICEETVKALLALDT